MESLLQDIYNVMFYHAEKDDVQISFREYLDEVGNFSESSFLEYVKTRKLYHFFNQVQTHESKIYLMFIFMFEYIRDITGYSGKLLDMELPIGDIRWILFDGECLTCPEEFGELKPSVLNKALKILDNL